MTATSGRTGEVAVPVVLGPGVATPPRRLGSIRRTSSLDMWWPAGRGTSTHILGRGRDLLTPADGSMARAVADDVLEVTAGPDRSVETIRSTPERADLSGLVGARAGTRLRAALVSAVPDERRRATLLYLLLDDLAGATLVAGFAFTQWPEFWPEEWGGDRERAFKGRKMEGVCIGLRTGSSGLDANGETRASDNARTVKPLPDPDDRLGWHELRDSDTVAMRRARRVDVWLDGDVVEIDAMFQDSATVPTGGRVAVHEYQIRAQARPDTLELVAIQVLPRVLPFTECPGAVSKIGQLVGQPLGGLRDEVLARLKNTEGCTHLNDEFRALADVPALVTRLLETA